MGGGTGHHVVRWGRNLFSGVGGPQEAGWLAHWEHAGLVGA